MKDYGCIIPHNLTYFIIYFKMPLWKRRGVLAFGVRGAKLRGGEAFTGSGGEPVNCLTV